MVSNKFWNNPRFVSKVISNYQTILQIRLWMELSKKAWKNNQIKTGHKLQSIWLDPSVPAFFVWLRHTKNSTSSGCGIVQIRILSA
jgi:hypothetical protein